MNAEYLAQWAILFSLAESFEHRWSQVRNQQYIESLENRSEKLCV